MALLQVTLINKIKEINKSLALKSTLFWMALLQVTLLFQNFNLREKYHLKSSHPHTSHV